MIEPAPYREDFDRLALAARGLRHPITLTTCPPYGGHGGEFRRFSLLAVEPVATISAADATGLIEFRPASTASPALPFFELPRAILFALSKLAPLDQNEQAFLEGRNIPPMGGLIGLLSYESGARFERMPSLKRGPQAVPIERPEAWFGVYPCLYLVDHLRREAWWVERDCDLMSESEASRAALRNWISSSWEDEIQETPEPRVGARRGLQPSLDAWTPSLDAPAYASAVERIRDYLRRGDAYQVNLTVRRRRRAPAPPERIFGRLLEMNPSPYAAFIRGEGWAIAGSSPELLLAVEPDGRVETHPIKGTIRRTGGAPLAGADEPEAARLLASAKDRAEHLMIVDLERNDLGKVCRFGSVGVDPFMAVESFTGLHHLVSRVRGRLRPGLGPVEALAAIFPGGSVTGAPKIRAMEIIAELEPAPRGFYTGAVGWISPEGAARFNLAIRTLAFEGGWLDLHAGGGIVVDSDPEAEAGEIRLKSEAMERAIEAAAEGAAGAAAEAD